MSFIPCPRLFFGRSFQYFLRPEDILGEEVLVSISVAKLVMNPRRRRLFWKNVFLVEESLKQQPGCLGYGLRRHLFGSEAWTMTAWTGERALIDFSRGEIHQQAIRESDGALKSASFYRRTLAKSVRPSWKWAEIQEKNGRNSSVGSLDRTAPKLR